MRLYPKVYIVILNFNAYGETIDCVNSVKKIRYSNYKIVIVDNNSTDRSADILRAHFPDEIILESPSNMGYAYGNNIGIRFALDEGAEYVCILNNDVEVEPDFLDIIIACMEKDKGIGMAGPCICEFNDKNKIQAMGANINLMTGLAQGKYKGQDYASSKNELLEVDYLGGACFVVSKAVLNKIGLIPENYFLFFEETEFCLRAKRSGYKLLCLGSSRVYHKRSATISKYSGLSYYFLNRNRIVFMRRNAGLFQKTIFACYLLVESIGRILIRKEGIKLFKCYYDGLKADPDNIDIGKISQYVGN